MPPRKGPLRNLQSIRTATSRSGQALTPHQAYLKLSCLEMEKARRNREKEAMMQRIKEMRARFREIEAEKAALLQYLAEFESQAAIESRSAEEPKPSLKNSSAFKLRY